MKRFFTSTALIALLASPVLAESHKMTDDELDKVRAEMNERMQSMQIEVSSLMDRRVYLPVETEGDMTDLDEAVADAPENWEMVGEVEDILLTKDGQVSSLLVDAGGFLGMNETRKQVDLGNLKFVPDADDEGEFFVVFTGDQSKFKEERSYDETAAAERGWMRASENEAFQPRERMVEDIKLTNLTTDEVLGAAAYDSNDNWIGEVGELALSDDGKIEAVIVDVGGFLGIGEKPVALNMDQVHLVRVDGNEVRARLSATEKELEAMDSWTAD